MHRPEYRARYEEIQDQICSKQLTSAYTLLRLPKWATWTALAAAIHVTILCADAFLLQMKPDFRDH